MTDTVGIRIQRPDPSAPILALIKGELVVRAGTTVTIAGREHVFEPDMPIALIDPVPGRDYAVVILDDGTPTLVGLSGKNPLDVGAFAGFHFAPGGNAEARAGGDTTPAINPHSLWDIGFRPACPDPRGMTCVAMKDGRRVWVDIYLLGTNHAEDGTSRHGATIADGASLDLLDYRTAAAIYAGHGKRLLTYEEFYTAAHGVTERSSADRDPKKTGLDAARTSRFGLMQATGNLWVWGNDNDPDEPRPSLFGGSWVDGSFAGSRHAVLGDWPGDSLDNLSARGASDHL